MYKLKNIRTKKKKVARKKVAKKVVRKKRAYKPVKKKIVRKKRPSEKTVLKTIKKAVSVQKKHMGIGAVKSKNLTDYKHAFDSAQREEKILNQFLHALQSSHPSLKKNIRENIKHQRQRIRDIKAYMRDLKKSI